MSFASAALPSVTYAGQESVRRGAGDLLLLCASLLAALEVPSKPFLDKNSFTSRRPDSRPCRQ